MLETEKSLREQDQEEERKEKPQKITIKTLPKGF